MLFASYIYSMKILKWIFFSIFTIGCVLSLVVVFLMYNNLTFIDYPYLIAAGVFFVLAILTFKIKIKSN